VGAEAIPVRDTSHTGRAAGMREITAIAILAALAVALAWFLVSTDMRSDLSALRPLRRATDPQTILVGWPEMRALQNPQKWSELRQGIRPADIRVRMLGYMMQGGTPASEGKEINTFVLMPTTGHILRSDSRNTDDMLEVWLRRPARFSDRELVWVSGRIEHAARASLAGDASPAASCVMRDSEVWPAEQREITRWFAP